MSVIDNFSAPNPKTGQKSPNPIPTANFFPPNFQSIFVPPLPFLTPQPSSIIPLQPHPSPSNLFSYLCNGEKSLLHTRTPTLLAGTALQPTAGLSCLYALPRRFRLGKLEPLLPLLECPFSQPTAERKPPFRHLRHHLHQPSLSRDDAPPAGFHTSQRLATNSQNPFRGSQLNCRYRQPLRRRLFAIHRSPHHQLLFQRILQR